MHLHLTAPHFDFTFIWIFNQSISNQHQILVLMPKFNPFIFKIHFRGAKKTKKQQPKNILSPFNQFPVDKIKVFPIPFLI